MSYATQIMCDERDGAVPVKRRPSDCIMDKMRELLERVDSIEKKLLDLDYLLGQTPARPVEEVRGVGSEYPSVFVAYQEHLDKCFSTLRRIETIIDRIDR